jgi:hypothetical protein
VLVIELFGELARLVTARSSAAACRAILLPARRLLVRDADLSAIFARPRAPICIGTLYHDPARSAFLLMTRCSPGDRGPA